MADPLSWIGTTADAVFAVDRRQRIVYWSSSARKLLGFVPAEVRGKHCYNVLAGEDHRGCSVCGSGCPVHALASTMQIAPNRELRIRARSGARLWVAVSTLPVPPHLRTDAVLFHFLRDIRRQKALENGVARLLTTISPTAAESVSDASPAVAPACHAAARLTPREREVLGLLASGASTEQIARRLGIRSATVRNHVRKILEKLDAHSRLEAVAHAIQRRLV